MPSTLLLLAGMLAAGAPAQAPATAESAVVVHRAGAAGAWENAGIRVTPLVDDAAGVYLGRLDFAPGAKVPPHRHPESEELISIVSGEGVIMVDGRKVTVKPGDSVRIPINALHDFAVEGAQPVHAIQVYTPKGPEARFKTWPAVKR